MTDRPTYEELEKRILDLEREKAVRKQKEAEILTFAATSANLSEGKVHALAVELTEAASRAISVERVGVWLFEESETRLVNIDNFTASKGVHSSGTLLLEHEFQDELSALKSTKYVAVYDALTDPRTAGYVESYLKPNHITSMLDVVIRFGDKNLGALCFEHVGSQHHWEDDEISFACQLADQLALAISNQERRRAELALAEETERRRILFEQSRDGIMVIDQAGKVFEANQRYADMLGYSVEEVQELYVWDWDARWSQEELEKQIRAIGPTGKIFETRHRKKDGSIIHVEISCNGADWQGQKLIYCICRDISDRKAAETALKESQERYKALFDRSLDFVFLADFEGRFLDANKALLDLLDYQRGDTPGLTFASVLSEDQLPLAYQKVGEVKSLGYQKSLSEYRIRRRDGREVIVEVHASLIYRDGKPFAIQGIGRDITERKRAEEALRESEARLLTLINATPDIICFKDARGAWVLANESILELYQLRDIDYRNKTECELADHTAPIFQEAFRNCSQSDDAAWNKGTLARSLELIPDVSGCERFYDVIKIPIYNPDSTRKGLVVFGRDITEFKRAEEEKDRLQAQLNQAQKLESIGRLAGGVAHDFNNMLGVILGYSELALARLDSSHPVHANLQEIRKAAERSANLTRQLLAFARKQTITPRVLDLNETVEGMLKMLRRLIGEDIDLAWLPKAGLWPVEMDPSQIDLILANLSVNAKDAIAGTGKVTIETDNVTIDEPGGAPGEYVLLSVSDNGYGMDRKTLESIFEPFFTTKAVDKGTGLGLSTVYGIVKQNNGFINVQSEPGCGTIFRIYLPRAEVEAPVEEELSEETRKFPGTETVLLVEDEESILSLGKVVLEKLGYEVLTAQDPADALALAESHSGRIHLLITDVVMPGMTGKDLKERLCSLNPGLRCLFMSGYPDEVIADHGVLDRGIHFLQKPFSVTAFGQKVREVLDS